MTDYDEPTSLPPELLKVWRKHRAEMERCWLEWQEGCSMRHETLYRKHEAVCDALESIGAREQERGQLVALRERVMALKSDCGPSEMRDAVIALKNDVMLGKVG